MGNTKTLARQFEELEKIAEALSREIDLEEAVTLYEKGVILAKELKKELQRKEKKIILLTEQGMEETDEETLGKK